MYVVRLCFLVLCVTTGGRRTAAGSTRGQAGNADPMDRIVAQIKTRFKVRITSYILHVTPSESEIFGPSLRPPSPLQRIPGRASRRSRPVPTEPTVGVFLRSRRTVVERLVPFETPRHRATRVCQRLTDRFFNKVFVQLNVNFKLFYSIL